MKNGVSSVAFATLTDCVAMACRKLEADCHLLLDSLRNPSQKAGRKRVAKKRRFIVVRSTDRSKSDRHSCARINKLGIAGQKMLWNYFCAKAEAEVSTQK